MSENTESALPPEGQQPAAEAPAAQVETPAVAAPQTNQFDGIQKRIDELTARYHDSERRASEMLSAKDQQIAQLANALSARLQPQTPDPLEGIHPDDRRKVEAIMTPQLRRIEEMTARLDAVMAQQRFEQATQQVGDDRVATIAKDLMADWRRRGLPGWTPEDAVIHAQGIVTMQEKQNAARPAPGRDTRGRFAESPNAAVLTAQAPSPSATPKKSDELPADIDDMIQRNPAKAAAILEKRLAGKKF